MKKGYGMYAAGKKSAKKATKGGKKGGGKKMPFAAAVKHAKSC